MHLELGADDARQLAEGIADLVLAKLGTRPRDSARGWLDRQAAADYLSCDVRRISDLKSAGILPADGFDGRRPLWRQATLDAYVQG